MIFPEDYINRIIQGDNLEVMKDNIPDNFMDLMVTDPPYGLGFMNKSWDEIVPKVEVWKECLLIFFLLFYNTRDLSQYR